MVQKINQEEFKTLGQEGIAVVDFSAEWCGPCKMLAPVMEEISEEMPDIKFFNIDVDENMTIAKEYRITSIPAVAVFKDGEKVDMNIGFVPKDAMVTFIDNAAK